MFKIDCPGCQAPYQVDERRVPSKGLKMRCPKCTTTFSVTLPGDGAPPAVSPVAGIREPGRGAPPLPKPRNQATMMGVAGPVPQKPPAPPVPPASAEGPGDPFGDLELPELPSVRPKPPRPSADVLPEHIELPAALPRRPPPAPAARDAELPDLPAARKSKAPAVAFADRQPPASDLPSPADPGRSASQRPSDPGNWLDLEPIEPAAGAPDLSEMDLPLTRDSALDDELPSLIGAGFGEAGLESSTGGFGEIELPTPGLGLEVPPEAPSAGASDLGFGELELEPPLELTQSPPALEGSEGESAAGGSAPLTPTFEDQDEALGFDEFDAFEPAPQAKGAEQGLDLTHVPTQPSAQDAPSLAPDPGSSVVRAQGGGVRYGEVDLGAGEAEALPLETRAPSFSDDDMEFGGIPQEKEAPEAQSIEADAPAVVPTLAEAPTRAPLPAPEPKRKRKGGRIAVGLLVLVSVGGGALALLPDVGPFGYYAISDVLSRGRYEKLLAETATQTQKQLARDTYEAARQALSQAEQARLSAQRYEPLSAHSAFAAFLAQLRFGTMPEVRARATVLLDQFPADEEGRYLRLSRSAQAAVDGRLDRAEALLAGVEPEARKKVEFWILKGELALQARQAKAAASAFQAAAKLESSPRTEFGQARSLWLLGEVQQAEKHAQAVLAQAAQHVGAQVLMAELESARGQEPKALERLEAVLKVLGSAGPAEQVAAQTLLGELSLTRSRITRAEAAFAAALRIDPKSGRALRGLADTLYKAGRYSESLARYEAAAHADDRDISAKLGVARTKLMLERLDEAKRLLTALRKSHPKHALTAYWYGRALEGVGERAPAEQAYRDALKLGNSARELVPPYVALASLLGQQGKPEAAQKILAQARERLPNVPGIYRALGDLALSQGRFADAKQELLHALKLEPEDLGTRFQLGVAYRRAGELEQASKVFDQVAQADKEYPGLALERGLLHEASGRTEQALKAYEDALAAAPDDPDLMLRVGCNKVTAGRGAQAEELLRKVLSKRPGSAETHYCLGRALLLQRPRLAEARRMFQAAADLDPHRPEYHLYVGWAANELGDLADAERSLKKALELDQSLGDAYWQRGVLLVKRGAVKDAVEDLKKALELRPSRHEAHAALADAYYDLGREDLALEHWKRAVTALPDQAAWHFRYGRLLAANRRDLLAREELARAVELGEKLEAEPPWLWEAQRLLARALGPVPAAVPHWEAFLRTGPRNSPYRGEAIEALARLGHPWKER